MIVHLTGTLVEKLPTRIVLDVNGVGYEVFITLATYEDLPATGKECRLHILHAVREDAELLYGFSDPRERAFFMTLTNVSGIGPALALNVLSGLPLVSLASAIAENDVPRLSRIKGVGKKTAQRLIVELRDKVSSLAPAEEASAQTGDGSDTIVSDAVLALIALGYRNADAYAAVKKVCARDGMDLPVEDIVRRALGALH